MVSFGLVQSIGNFPREEVSFAAGLGRVGGVSGAVFRKKIGAGDIPRGGCRRGKEWKARAAIGRGPPPEPPASTAESPCAFGGRAAGGTPSGAIEDPDLRP